MSEKGIQAYKGRVLTAHPEQHNSRTPWYGYTLPVEDKVGDTDLSFRMPKFVRITVAERVSNRIPMFRAQIDCARPHYNKIIGSCHSNCRERGSGMHLHHRKSTSIAWSGQPMLYFCGDRVGPVILDELNRRTEMYDNEEMPSRVL